MKRILILVCLLLCACASRGEYPHSWDRDYRTGKISEAEYCKRVYLWGKVPGHQEIYTPDGHIMNEDGSFMTRGQYARYYKNHPDSLRPDQLDYEDSK